MKLVKQLRDTAKHHRGGYTLHECNAKHRRKVAANYGQRDASRNEEEDAMGLSQKDLDKAKEAGQKGNTVPTTGMPHGDKLKVDAAVNAGKYKK
jgi:hypothetical protein